MKGKTTRLPPHMRAMRKSSGKTYYYFDRGIQSDGSRPFVPLGSDYLEALRKYADLSIKAVKPAATFGEAVRRFQVEALAERKPSTQKDILWSLPHLLEFFDSPPAPFAGIKPVHVRAYLDRRAKTAPVRANREIAWFSVIWNWARERGITDVPNPTAGVRRNKETGRTHYVTDEELDAIKAEACQPLKDAIDLAYLTGQRPADVLKLNETDIRDGALELRQNKTGMPLRIALTGELGQLVSRLIENKRSHSVRSLALLVTEKGVAMSKPMLRRRFDIAREAAAANPKNKESAIRIRAMQFRDLRAKAATDKADSAGDIRQAQQQLGHASVTMTEHYVRKRRGAKVSPTK